MTPPAVLVVGPLPPPLHGAAAITAAVADRLDPRASVRRCDIAPDSLARGMAYHLQRIGRVAKAAGAVAIAARGSLVYLSAAGGIGLVYNLLIAAVARLRRLRLVVHHHSFAYLDRRSAVMAGLARVAGGAAVHVALCERMAAQLQARYAAVRHVRVLSNAAFVAPRVPSPAAAGPLRLGHLGNLCDDKGLDRVLASFAAARAAGLPVRLILAGPPADAAAAGAIAAAVATDVACEHRGPVSGDDKARFFADIDVFLFPTRYVNEAEPLVVFEALAHGVPVIATGRGCIAEQLGAVSGSGDGGTVVPTDVPFVPRALAALRAFAASPAQLAMSKTAARQRAERLHAVAQGQLDALLDLLTGERA